MREMRDSGVGYLREIPAEWGVEPIKRHFKIVKRIAGGTGYDVLSITQRGLRVKDVETGGGQLAADYSNYQIVEPGDFAMNHMDLLTGWVDLSDKLGVTSPDYRVFQARSKEVDKRYFLRVFQTYYAARIFYGMGKGIAGQGRWRLPAAAFNAALTPLPPFPEQRRIADWLDEQCASIDAAVEAARASIDEYEAYKKSVIACAVTRGLDPDAPLKDTGIPWLGQVPEGWKLVRLRRIATCHNGDRSKNYPTGDDLVSEGIPIVTSSELTGTLLSRNFNKFITREKYDTLSGVKLRQGDIVFCLRGSIGGCALNDFLDDGVIASSLTVVRPRGNCCHPAWLNYVLGAPASTYQAIANAIGATSLNLSAAELSGIYIPLPPLPEQHAIAAYLDSRTSAIDAVVAQKRAIVDDLLAYRKSLVYEAVTGKREV